MNVEELKEAIHKRFLAHGWHDEALWAEAAAQLDGALPAGAQPDGVQPGSTLPDDALPDGTQRGGTLLDAVQPEGARSGGALLNTACWMEETGGEPAVAPWWHADEPLVLCDCSAESPAERRSLCYDRAAWEKRKKARPAGDATSLAVEHGARLLTEDEYLQLQSAGEFDRKTSSWLLTPDDVRSQGGALFGDRRFGRPFIYCNGADSYYAVRGFRVSATA